MSELRLIDPDPASVFTGNLVFTIPHMDDEVLACGGTIARLTEKERIHFIYATDGAKSPAPAFDWMAPHRGDLSETRIAEAESALDVLGVPKHNLYFLDFPDGSLREHVPALRDVLVKLYDRLQPAHVFVPFRYDRHPDHLAVHEAAMGALGYLGKKVSVAEYFVYYRWRLLPGGDVRRFIRTEHLLRVEIQAQRELKRRALECYRSQTTRYYPWQHRPILSPERVIEVSNSPENFVLHNGAFRDAAIFSRLRPWIRVVHWAEPRLKVAKDRFILLARSVVRYFSKDVSEQ